MSEEMVLPNSKELFVHLLLRLRNYNDAAVLWIFLRKHCDEKEKGATVGNLHFDDLGETVSKSSIQRSIGKLAMNGYISVRPHKNTRTLITVNRDAVLELLRQPLINGWRLPGIADIEFPFLAAWHGDAAALQAAQTPEPDLNDPEVWERMQARELARKEKNRPKSSEEVTH